MEVARMGSIFFGGIAGPQQSDRVDELRNVPRIALLTVTPRHGLRQQHHLSISRSAELMEESMAHVPAGWSKMLEIKGQKAEVPLAPSRASSHIPKNYKFPLST
jgi:hypothetical protein